MLIFNILDLFHNFGVQTYIKLTNKTRVFIVNSPLAALSMLI